MQDAKLSVFARATIESLGLEAHPEGGWYRRTWQSSMAAGQASDAADTSDMGEYATGARPLASLIYFLLPAGEASAWHVVDADELWLWHGPGKVTLELGGTGAAPDEGNVTRVVLGIDRETPEDVCGQAIIPAGTWQRTLPTTDDALVSCVVSPGFVYAGFDLYSSRASQPHHPSPVQLARLPE